MPYRRLPNTDAARIRAMRIALDRGRELPPNLMVYSARLMVRIQKFLPLFENNVQIQHEAIATNNKTSKEYNEIIRKARIYLTHFVRVMNMAIVRGDLPAETRAFYGLATNESTLPALNTENELITWGRRIIEGEELRIRKGGSPITNPTIAVVKVRFGNFIEAWHFHKTHVKKTMDYNGRTSEMRKEADEIILQIWNEVEAFHSNLPEDQKKKACENYGLVYFYRKNEIPKPALPELQTFIIS